MTGTHSTLRVLVVEDNTGDCELAVAALVADGVRAVHIAPTLALALNLVGVVAPDVVVLDLGLPDSTGLSTLHAIMAKAPFLPVVVVTGSDEAALGDSAVRKGAQDFITKGVALQCALAKAVRFAAVRGRIRVAHDAVAQNQALLGEISERRAELDSLASENARLLTVILDMSESARMLALKEKT
jgi:DNA-binding NarL/FixJ family response regulator